MIRVHRGAEPEALRTLRLKRRPELARLAGTRPFITSDFEGYTVVAGDLWRGQRSKCCYCESKIQCSYSDVEHYRPKTSAKRHPGSSETHGYWWLAFTWTNLLYSCNGCNRSAKKDQFPLDAGSVALVAQDAPPGKEIPLLVDPADENGIEHIEFVFSAIMTPVTTRHLTPHSQALRHWLPRARSGSKKGEMTIRVCKLDRQELIELYDAHVKSHVRPVTDDLNRALGSGQQVREPFDRALRLLQPGMPFVGLSYDALRLLVPDGALAPWKLAWPALGEVGKPAPTKRRRT